jgi:transcriptional regulator GlxA family with amidase domain
MNTPGSGCANWLHQQRLLLARRLLETTDLPVPRIAERSGYGSANALRAHFTRDLATSPQRYRQSFRRG